MVAAIDPVGRELGHRAFPTTPQGYRELLDWLRGFGSITQVGVEGTGSYAAGLTRMLMAAQISVVEVDRPDRKARRLHGKSDPIDAYAAARAALSGRADATPKARTGPVEMIRVLRATRDGAVKAKTAAWNQLHAFILTAPEDLRTQLRPLTKATLLNACIKLRPARTRPDGSTKQHRGDLIDPTAATKTALGRIARRIRTLEHEIADHDTDLDSLVKATGPTLISRFGVGVDVAGQLLTTIGDNPDRMRSEAAFAHLCGVAPIPASSGRTQRHRLNRGGDRQANRAIWRVAITRLSFDERTRAYHDRKAKEQKSNKEIIRSLKRYIARELYQAILTDLTPPKTAT
jgi:transposase